MSYWHIDRHIISCHTDISTNISTDLLAKLWQSVGWCIDWLSADTVGRYVWQLIVHLHAPDCWLRHNDWCVGRSLTKISSEWWLAVANAGQKVLTNMSMECRPTLDQLSINMLTKWRSIVSPRDTLNTHGRLVILLSIVIDGADQAGVWRLPEPWTGPLDLLSGEIIVEEKVSYVPPLPLSRPSLYKFLQ